MTGVTELSEIAGYRVVRRLRSGHRADVHLGYALAIDAAGKAGESTSVELTVFRPEIDLDSIDTEVAAMCAVPTGVAPRLHDVVSVADGRVCLVTERVSGPSLAHLVQQRGSIRAGEAVTIAATVVVALGRLHDAGFAHGSLSLAAIRFDESGRPLLYDLAGLRRLPAQGTPSTAPERLASIRADYERMATLVSELLQAVDPASVSGGVREEFSAWIRERLNARPFLPFAADLERRIFAMARPLAVRLTSRSAGSPNTGVPARVIAPARWPVSVESGGTGSETAAEEGKNPSGGGFLNLFPAPSEMVNTMEAVLEARPVAAFVSRARRLFDGRRRPLAVAACLSIAMIVVALTFIPPGDARDAVDGRTGRGKDEEDGRDTGLAGSPRRADYSIAVNADDPIAAATALVERRVECFASSSVICLDDAVESGSPLAAADSAAIRRAQQNDTHAVPETIGLSEATVVERNGNAALVAATRQGQSVSGANDEPAPLLMIKGEAGWRLREIFGP
ncbi:hypothetical protein [Luethyella okanaganae]|uniref:Protein kinase domain-containing protein n=1 Tax=Luethyella okanaganae TaxID=69372 RepID=A0ABW1VEH7_9MICO